MSKFIDITNTTEDKGIFKAFIPMSEQNGKTSVIEKINSGGLKQKFLIGVATNTQIDKEDERMTKNFINKIRFGCKGLNVFVEHEHSIEKTIGFIEDVGGDEDNLELSVALESEENNSLVKTILSKIDHGTKIGFSIGGKILKAKKVFDTVLNKWINEIDDGEIYEVSVTAIPAGNGTWASVIQKSAKELMKTKEVVAQFNEGLQKTLAEDNLTISKVLDEMIEGDKMRSKLYDFFYAFKQAIYNIMESERTPEQKKETIMAVSEEFARKIEELSTAMITAAQSVEEQLGYNEVKD